MRPSLQQTLLAVLEKQMSIGLPTFRVCDFAKDSGPGRMFIDSSLIPAFFVFFQIAEKRDAFTVEIAWSVDGIYPPIADYPVPRDWPDLNVRRGDLGLTHFRFRLSKLWVPPKYDPWWEFFPSSLDISKSKSMSIVPDQGLNDEERCQFLVLNAVERIKDEGVKYMSDIRARF
jgi:hypothetical protein